jgi:hypothetical protein
MDERGGCPSVSVAPTEGLQPSPRRGVSRDRSRGAPVHRGPQVFQRAALELVNAIAAEGFVMEFPAEPPAETRALLEAMHVRVRVDDSLDDPRVGRE